MKKIILRASVILLIGYVIPVLLYSCNCKEKINYCHTVDSLSIKGMDNSGISPVDIRPAGVLGKAFMMQLQVHDHTDICHNPGLNPFINTAFAFKRDCNVDIYNDSVIHVAITSNHDFDDKHGAGVELINLFKMTDSVQLSTELKGDFYLLQSPADTGTHIFNVILTMANGKVISRSTAPIKLLK